jgi:SOS response regulatory protein OraA/RecX
MKEIDEDDYIKTIKNLAGKKMSQLKKDPRKNFKTIQYLISRGFESELVIATLNDPEHLG